MPKIPKGISPTPWTIRTRGDSADIHSTDGACVASCESSWADNIANAKLIVAAPELLKMATKLVHGDDQSDCNFCSKVDWGTENHDRECPVAMAYKIITELEEKNEKQ